MRRSKRHIITVLYGDQPDLDGAVLMSNTWSNQIFIAQPPGKGGLDTIANVKVWSQQLTSGRDDKMAVWFDLDLHIQDHRSWNGMISAETIVGLEPNWVISDPHIVRDAIELNPENTLMAKRYFMWNDTHYRKDGIYTPIAIPAAYPYRYGAVFNSPVDVAPRYAWASGTQTDAPFAILDYTYHGHNTEGATLREFEGMIPV